MKRAHIASSSTNATEKPRIKRPRNRATGFLQYSSKPPIEPDSLRNTVQVVKVAAKSRGGRFGVKRSNITVERPEETIVIDDSGIEQEDPDAQDAALWEDMLGDDVFNIVKRKKKQRNDSVSRCLCSSEIQLMQALLDENEALDKKCSPGFLGRASEARRSWRSYSAGLVSQLREGSWVDPLLGMLR